MGEGNLRAGGGAKGRSNSGNNFCVDSSQAKSFELFPAPSEDERIATFKANDVQAHERVLNQELVDVLLGRALHPAALAHIDQLGVVRDQRKDLSAYQA